MSTSSSPGPSQPRVTNQSNHEADSLAPPAELLEPVVTIKTGKPSGCHHRKRMPYFGDALLVPRVVTFINHLQENSNTPKEQYIDVDQIVDELQSKYRDYQKKKRGPFKASIQKALTVIMENNGSKSDGSYESSGEGEESEDCLEMDDSITGVNNQVVNMYMQSAASTTRSVSTTMDGEKELIDIGSSDDEEEDSHSLDMTDAVREATMAQHEYRRQELMRQEMLRQAKMRQSSVIQAAAAKRAQEASSKATPAIPSALEVKPSTPNILRKRKTPPEADYESRNNPSKKKKESRAVEVTTVTFKDIGGNDKCLKEVCQLLVHIKHPEVYQQLGVSPPRGFLLHGPPGCGKTLLAHAIAGELHIPLVKVAATELVAGVSGESEERIRELFDQAIHSAPCVLFIDEVDAIAPHRSTAQREMERRMVAQLLSSLDGLGLVPGGEQVLVVGATNRPDALDPALRRAGRFDREVSLGIPDEKARTSILQVLCAKLRLAPKIDLHLLGKLTPGFVGADLSALTREAAMTALNRVLRDIKEKTPISKSTVIKTESSEKKNSDEKNSLEKSSNKKKSEDSEEKKVADEVSSKVDAETTETEENLNGPETDEKVSPTQVNGDVEMTDLENVGVASIAKKDKELPSLDQLMEWLKEKSPLSPEQLQSLFIEHADFASALKVVQPSAKREGFATVPDVTWEDVGSMGNIRDELKMTILAPVKYAEQFAALGLTSPAGVLLCGPPGCGKTLLAKAVANEAGMNFISVKGPELLNMYVGESERAVRQCFQRARNSAPCVIFFDELDSLCPKRSDTGEGGASMRVVNQMLTEMDGIEGRRGVFLMAATNRPDIVDPAVLRPGRLDKILYVGLPDQVDRADILRALTKGGISPKLAEDVDLTVLGSNCHTQNYTGADLAALVREASVEVLRGVMADGQPDTALVVQMKHFKRALAKIRPSVSEIDRKRYESLRLLYGTKSQVDEKPLEA